MVASYVQATSDTNISLLIDVCHKWYLISDIKYICTNVALAGEQYDMLATNQVGLANHRPVFGGMPSCHVRLWYVSRIELNVTLLCSPKEGKLWNWSHVSLLSVSLLQFIGNGPQDFFILIFSIRYGLWMMLVFYKLRYCVLWHQTFDQTLSALSVNMVEFAVGRFWAAKYAIDLTLEALGRFFWTPLYIFHSHSSMIIDRSQQYLVAVGQYVMSGALW